MTNASNMNIDFLLGLPASTDGISPAGSSGVENGGPLFAEMLNDMLMSYPGAGARPLINPEVPEAAPFVKQFELVEQADTGTPPDASATRLTENQQASSIAAQPVQTVVDENVRAFNNDIRSQLPTDALPLMTRSVSMNLAVPTTLEVGSYEITESRHSDGTIQLKLMDPTARESAIQVSLPAEMLTAGMSESSSEKSTPQVKAMRVDLDAMPKQSTSVERLFAQLNLKQIEVSQISNPAGKNDSSSNMVAIKLSGVKNDGVDVQLKALIPQDQLTALNVKPHHAAAISSKANNNASIQSPDTIQGALTNTGDLDPQLSSSRQVPTTNAKHVAGQEISKDTQPSRAGATVAQFFAPTQAPKIRNIGSQMRSNRMDTAGRTRSAVSATPQTIARTENDQLLTTFSQSLKQNQIVANKVASNVVGQTTSNFDLSTFGSDSEPTGPFANLDNIGETGKTLTGKLSKSAVRFSLPDDLASKLKPNGQSVMIRIEPENLGPARLSLRMHQDKLSARITVETVGIKAVVEQSLDRLTQQLVKSGIDIERIEVALDGRQSGDQLSERHPHWQRQARPTHFDENILTETNEVNPNSPVPATAPAFVGSGGVNILA